MFEFEISISDFVGKIDLLLFSLGYIVLTLPEQLQQLSWYYPYPETDLYT